MIPTGAASFRPCILVPTYNNPRTIEGVVQACRAYLPDVVVVDDGGSAESRAVLQTLESKRLIHLVVRPVNGGKGAAVKDGLAAARDLGFSHVLQVDADGQHTMTDIPRLLEASQARPEALVLGAPEFDDTAPKSRRVARRITQFWVNLETGGAVIRDPMCGFRVYPVAPALRTQTRGNRMDFDPEIAVRLVWLGVPVVHVPTAVRYLTEEEGGVSHFRLVHDNWLISAMHFRLMFRKVMGSVLAAVGFSRMRLPRGAST